MTSLERVWQTGGVNLDRIAGIILAGGASRRFGPDKALAAVNGMSLLERVAGSLEPCRPRLIVAPPGRYTLDGWQPVPDTRLGEGPLAGLEAGLGALATDQWAGCAAVDLPHLTPAFWASLARSIQPGAQAVTGFSADGRAQPLAALYHASALSAVTALLNGGERRMAALLERLDVVKIEWAALGMPEGVYHNVNRLEDLPDG
jgi:molybdenum cofactor guanylyltransferase